MPHSNVSDREKTVPVEASQATEPDTGIHIDIRCPKCGGDMVDLDFAMEDHGDSFHWTAFRKCPRCGTRVLWE
ncbi:MAG: hypothetical protein ACE5Z5_12330 [Candidatus Bathyarchaeia archaeon]